MKLKRKRIVRVAGVLMALYALASIPLWLGGGYILTESGKVRQLLGVQTGIAAPDIADWQPLVGHCQPEYHWPTGDVSPRCDTLGWIYYPMWLLLRRSYPTVQLLTTGGGIVKNPSFPPGFRIHPLRGEDLRGIMQVTPNASR